MTSATPRLRDTAGVASLPEATPVQSLELINTAIEALSQAAEIMPQEADSMPTIEAGDVVASQVERIGPAIDLLTSIASVLQGGDPADDSADTAVSDAAEAEVA